MLRSTTYTPLQHIRCLGLKHMQWTSTLQKNDFIVQPQLDYGYIADHAHQVVDNMQARRYDPINPTEFQHLYQQRKDIYQQLLLLRSQRNALSKAAASHQKQQRSKTPSSPSAAAAALASNTRERSIQQAQVLKADIKKHEHQLETN
ncbi:unnamed protein product [Absidia cylindrospora]